MLIFASKRFIQHIPKDSYNTFQKIHTTHSKDSYNTFQRFIQHLTLFPLWRKWWSWRWPPYSLFAWAHSAPRARAIAARKIRQNAAKARRRPARNARSSARPTKNAASSRANALSNPKNATSSKENAISSKESAISRRNRAASKAKKNLAASNA